MPLLSPDDPPCYRVLPARGSSAFVLTCDHAGNLLPRALGSLGLSDRALASHIAWDLGIAALGQKLAEELSAFLITQTYSRLVIDVNRPLESPESIATRSEDTDIPGNVGVTREQAEERAAEVFWPYHQRLTSELDRRQRLGQRCVLVALHSFTPVFLGVARSVELGVLYGRDARVGKALLARLRGDPSINVGDNAPYAFSPASDYTLLVHGEQRGIAGVELELRQDLLASEANQRAWVKRLAALLTEAASELFPE
jgi:predicted N-formylglutamate amidohydrolase